jgi:hypothetical protein
MDYIFKCATAADMEASQKKLTELYDASNAADSAYRTAKAAEFVRLSNPTDGSKKPSESMILAMIDSNKSIIALREAAAKASAELEIAKMMFKATIAVVTRNG